MSETYTLPPGIRHLRADKALALSHPEHSRTAFRRAFDAGLVTRGGQPISGDTNVQSGDVLEYSFPETRAAELKAVKIPLDVIFEDRHLLAVNKPAGMIVHPGAGTGEDTLVHALLAHCAGSLSGIGGVERPGIVHRLDRETSGLIVVAKSDAAHRGLAEQFSERTLQKEYLALVSGVPTLMSGSIRKSIGRNPSQRHKMAVVEEESGGKDAHTDWEVVERFAPFATLLRCAIHTGRTHQIRVHLKSIGHVLLGDAVYGWKSDPRLPLPPARVMLHAEHLVLRHPITGRALDLRAPLPADFRKLVTSLRKLSAPAPAPRAKAPTRKARRPAR
ncbi:MAG TPA: RluA family pseudouridine synthase [Opitutaceae bacterium]|nr:RluA family pseudouridine synthase [Opitutaceae bacterium]HND61182.1 RluA family pseudouridine synthase [Opitutaceae bacterium]